MAGLRDKLKTMASLSADWNAPAAAPEEQPSGGLGDDVFFYPMDHKTGDYCLKSFLSIDEEAFFGLNDEEPLDLDPRRVLFLDTETTGLFGASVQAFLVGLGYFTNQGFCVRQLLMRDLASESLLLEKLNEIYENFDVIVTFNGKSYDVPLLQTRMLFCRMRDKTPEVHIDLIHPARRIYKLRIESCRLSNIEDKVFHAGRHEDIDGAEIPGRYYRYVRTGDESLLTDILEHNRQDITSMPLLACAMCRALEEPEVNESGADRFSIGRYYQRQNNPEMAEKYYSSVTEGLWSLPSLWQKSLLLKKSALSSAVACWEEIIEHTPDYCPALMELCKYHEHQTKDIATALDLCIRAQETGMGKMKFSDDLAKRRARLEKKLNKS